MYGFRKPYAVAAYAGLSLGPLDLKDALIISQLVGYTISKYVGIKICSEIPPRRRAVALVVLIVWAEAALLLMGLLPPSLQPIALLLNGLPLGAVWGLVFGFLEGRRTTDLLGAGLSCSYIVASGAVKSMGQIWLGLGVPERWMPFVTGLCFLAPFLAAVWLLDQIPPPSRQDVDLKTAREPMDSRARYAFLRRFLGGLLPLVILYFFLTALRDYRDNYSKEIWSTFDLGDQAVVYAAPELLIALSVMGALAFLTIFRNNRTAVRVIYAMMMTGAALIGLATLCFELGILSGPVWMTLVGMGLYLAYVPFGAMLFDRIIALLGTVATAVFTIYLTDAVGYTGSIVVILYKKFGHAQLSKLEFFEGFCWFTSALCLVCFAASLVYFERRGSRRE
ncbi:MAG: hypothetical protein JRG91_15385 [Deltaproteobacteria bacterium]|nr:hypothetical protein [Deltaproteobacteria bacterium]